MVTKFKEKILELRSKGKSYNEIMLELGCSKGTIAYHCGKGQKEKYKQNRKRNRLKAVSKLKSKIDSFNYTHKNSKKIRNARDKFFRGLEDGVDIKNCSGFSTDELIEMISNHPFCYLTGRPIDFNNPDSLSLDHIIPRSKGGDNSINNLGITCKEANFAKRDLLLEDFIKLCRDVLVNFGYKVESGT